MSTNFTAVRLRRDILRRSSNVGVIATTDAVAGERQHRTDAGASYGLGVDARCCFFENIKPDGVLRAHQHTDASA